MLPSHYSHQYGHLPRIEQAFSRKALKRVCEMDERDFAAEYGMQVVQVHDQPYPNDFFLYKDNGSSVLAVAHLDTVADGDERTCRFVVTEGAGTVVFSRALDDRLGAYIILELLPALGITHDILLTVGEEMGQSTAAYFQPPEGKEYDWMIEFDRGGTDVVMYQYEDAETRAMVRNCGAEVGVGIFSDISYMDHLGIKGYNWGVGYQDYHGPRAHAFLNDTFRMVDHYLDFHYEWEGVAMPHYGGDRWSPYGSGYIRRPSWASGWDEGEDKALWENDDLDEDDLRREYGGLHVEPVERAAVLDPDDLTHGFSEYPSLEELNRALEVADT